MTPSPVYLVGAGPGDPGLITVRGLNALRQATVVIYDRLVHPSLIEEAPPIAQRIYVGKESGIHCAPQAQINQLLVKYAAQGEQVVRLKGGDPFVFGHGRAPETPVALIRWGTTSEQYTLIGTLADIADKAATIGLEPPAVTVIGDVVNLAGRLQWFLPAPQASSSSILVSKSDVSLLLADTYSM